MSQPPQPPYLLGQGLAREGAVRNYVFLCLGALAIILVILLRRHLDLWSFLPVLLGVAGVLLGWRIAPTLTLALVALMLLIVELPRGRGHDWSQFSHQEPDLQTWFLCGAVLGFMAGIYRLHGLTVGLFPPERRFEHATIDQLVEPASIGLGREHARPGRLVSSWEIPLLLIGIPVWGLIAQLVVQLFGGMTPVPVLQSQVWAVIVLTWFFGLVVLVAAGILGHVARLRMTEREARLLLQDALWLETRRDQRRVNRWLGERGVPWLRSGVQPPEGDKP